jgi:hypothetical protein
MSDPLLNDADEEALRQMMAQDSGFAKEMEIDFAVEVPDREAGIAFATLVTPLGFHTHVNEDNTNGKWLCHCARVMEPTYDAIMAVQEILAELGHPFKVKSERWESFGRTNL